MSKHRDLESFRRDLYELLDEFEAIYKTGSVEDLSLFVKMYNEILSDARMHAIRTGSLETEAGKKITETVGACREDHEKLDMILKNFPGVGGKLVSLMAGKNPENASIYAEAWLRNEESDQRFSEAVDFGFQVAKDTQSHFILLNVLNSVSSRLISGDSDSANRLMSLNSMVDALAEFSHFENTSANPIGDIDSVVAHILAMMRNKGGVGQVKLDAIFKLLDSDYRPIGENVFKAFPVHLPTVGDLCKLNTQYGLSYTQQDMLDNLRLIFPTYYASDVSSSYISFKMLQGDTSGYELLLQNTQISGQWISYVFDRNYQCLDADPPIESLCAAAEVVVEHSKGMDSDERGDIMSAMRRLPRWNHVEQHLKSSHRTSRIMLRDDFGL